MVELALLAPNTQEVYVLAARLVGWLARTCQQLCHSSRNSSVILSNMEKCFFIVSSV